jgi:hypothetical protein
VALEGTLPRSPGRPLKAQPIATASTQLRTVVDGLGRQAQNVSVATTPTVVGSDLYLELRSDTVAAGSAATCVHWRYRSEIKELQSRSWRTMIASATPWRTVVTDLGNDLATRPPFTVQAADSVHVRPVVTVDLLVTPRGQPTSLVTNAFGLKNYLSAPAGAVCTEAARG